MTFHLLVEVRDAVRADPTRVDLDLGNTMFAWSAAAEGATILLSEALHVAAGRGLGYAEINPMRRKARVELLRTPLRLCDGPSAGAVKDAPLGVAEPQVNALPDPILSDHEARGPLDQSPIRPEASPVHERSAAGHMDVVQTGASGAALEWAIRCTEALFTAGRRSHRSYTFAEHRGSAAKRDSKKKAGRGEPPSRFVSS